MSDLQVDREERALCTSHRPFMVPLLGALGVVNCSMVVRHWYTGGKPTRTWHWSELVKPGLVLEGYAALAQLPSCVSCSRWTPAYEDGGKSSRYEHMHSCGCSNVGAAWTWAPGGTGQA